MKPIWHNKTCGECAWLWGCYCRRVSWGFWEAKVSNTHTLVGDLGEVSLETPACPDFVKKPKESQER